MKLSEHCLKGIASVNQKIDEKCSQVFDKPEKALSIKLNPLIVTGLLLIGLFVSILSIDMFTSCFEVLYNENHIAYVNSEAEAEEAIARVESDIAGELGCEKTSIADQIQIVEAKSIGDRSDANSVYAMLNDEDMDIKIKGAAIDIEGKDKIYVSSVDEGNAVLEAYIRQFADNREGEILKQELKEPVLIEEVAVSPDEVTNKESIVARFKGEVTEPENVVASRGDNLAVENTASAVPEVKAEEITPVLTVVTTERREYDEEIPYETERNENASGTENITQEGKPGVKHCIAEFVYENDKEVGKTVLEETIVQEPVKQIVEVNNTSSSSTGSGSSTAKLAGISGSGLFIMPTSGRVGEIFRPNGGSSNHSGGCAIDILNSSGTPIYASAAGKVTTASWYGGYGNCIIIQHDNGFSTLYGHLSGYSVSAGDTVSQGEHIGSMGTTGSSTANHLHFEIRYGGSAQPINDYFNVSSGNSV